MQIGGLLAVGEAAAGGFELRMAPPVGAVASRIEIRTTTDVVHRDVATGSAYLLPPRLDPQTVATALVVYLDDQDKVMSVSGGQFNVDEANRVAEPSTDPQGDVKIAVVNATDQPGLAGAVAQVLDPHGYITAVMNASTGPAESSVICYVSGYGNDARAVAGSLEIPAELISPAPSDIASLVRNGDDVADFHIFIILGTDRPIPVPDGQILVPNVRNRSLVDATVTLTNAGFRVETIDELSETVVIGSVIDSDPGSGTALAPGALITVIVSSGISLVSVPDVVGLLADSAQLVLERSSLVVEVTFEQVPEGSPEVGRVRFQHPPAALEVEQNTVVEIIVGESTTG